MTKQSMVRGREGGREGDGRRTRMEVGKKGGGKSRSVRCSGRWNEQ